jgi:sugar lactone lactonase YvrE
MTLLTSQTIKRWRPTRMAAAPRFRRVGSAMVALVLAGLAGCGTSGPRPPAVVASGLANPRQMSFGPDGVLYVAEAGSGGHEHCAVAPDSKDRVCIGDSGAILSIKSGTVRRVITGLPSAAAVGGAESSGVADVVASHSQASFVVQDTYISKTGANQFETAGKYLGHLVFASLKRRTLRIGADFGRFEATHNPDHGAGASAAEAIESDPYGLVAYRGGFVVADAAGNDLLWVTATGKIRVLAVFPIQYETLTATNGHTQRVAVQSVPTSVAIGRGGALYVGELTGYPFRPGFARIWRVAPGHAATVYATGFTCISAIAFDNSGRLLVLEIDRDGLLDPRASGELIRVDGPRRRTVLKTSGLVFPTGVAVATDGAIYISNNGTSAAHGEIIRLADE